jgi:hypothetical protein
MYGQFPWQAILSPMERRRRALPCTWHEADVVLAVLQGCSRLARQVGGGWKRKRGVPCAAAQPQAPQKDDVAGRGRVGVSAHVTQ